MSSGPQSSSSRPATSGAVLAYPQPAKQRPKRTCIALTIPARAAYQLCLPMFCGSPRLNVALPSARLLREGWHLPPGRLYLDGIPLVSVRLESAEVPNLPVTKLRCLSRIPKKWERIPRPSVGFCRLHRLLFRATPCNILLTLTFSIRCMNLLIFSRTGTPSALFPRNL